MECHRSDYDEIVRHERITINLTRRDAEGLLRDLKVLNGPPPAGGGVWSVPVAGVLQVLLDDQIACAGRAEAAPQPEEHDA